MWPKILIIIGFILFLLGLAGLISVFLQSILKAIRVFYKQDKDDYIYEHGKGQKIIEESRKLLAKLFIILIVSGLALLLFGLAWQHMPIGNDSIFSTETAGIDVGDDEQSNISLKEYSSDDNTNGINADYYIKISGDIISLNEKTFGTIEDFENTLKDLDRTKKVVITDDYAISAIYHQVEDLINKYGLERGDDSE